MTNISRHLKTSQDPKPPDPAQAHHKPDRDLSSSVTIWTFSPSWVDAPEISSNVFHVVSSATKVHSYIFPGNKHRRIGILEQLQFSNSKRSAITSVVTRKCTGICTSPSHQMSMSRGLGKNQLLTNSFRSYRIEKTHH